MKRLLFCLAAIGASWVAAEPGQDQAREAARQFGRALTSAQASALRPILPQEGKVQLTLSRLGPENGSFAAGQVEAVFRDFLGSGSVRSFDIVRMESDGRTSTLVHGKALVVDREGRQARIALHLALQPEADRWVLREVKESPE